MQNEFGLRGADETPGPYRDSNWNWSYSPLSRRIAGFKALLQFHISCVLC